MKGLLLVVGILVLLSVACMEVTWAATTPAADYIFTPPKATKAPTPTATQRVDVNTVPVTEIASECVVATGIPVGMLHLRACGSTACPVLDWLEEGQEITILERGQWSWVQAGEKTGYVNSMYISCGGQ
jgi:hypothetical protein